MQSSFTQQSARALFAENKVRFTRANNCGVTFRPTFLRSKVGPAEGYRFKITCKYQL